MTERGRATALAAAVAALALLPYLQTARFGPTYDDHAHVLDNVFVHHPENARFLLSPRYLDLELPDQGRPVLLASLLLDRALFGEWFGGYHLQSAAWHALAALLAFVLARRLRLGVWPAAAGAAVFALHPACTEAVASVSNREDPLAAVFVLGALLAAGRFLRGGWGWGAWGWLPIAALAFALGLGAKEMALATPPLLAALAAASPEWRAADRPRTRWLALAGAGAAVVAAFAAFQLRLGAPSLTIGSGGSPLESAGPGPLAAWLWLGRSRVLTEAAIGWAQAIPLEAHRFLRVLIGWPLSAEHDPTPFGTGVAVLLGAVALSGLVAVGVALHRRERRDALGLTWFLAATAPVLASPWLLNPIADRFLYLPAIGVSIALGGALARPRPARWPRLLLLAILAVFASRSAARVTVWRDDATLFADAVRHAPRSARAWQNLGAARLRRGDLDAAEDALERATELDASLLAPRLNLGLVALRRGEADRAFEELGRAVDLPVVRGERDLHARAFRLYARLLGRRGRREELEAAVRDELARDPESADARAWRERLDHEPPPNE